MNISENLSFVFWGVLSVFWEIPCPRAFPTINLEVVNRVLDAYDERLLSPSQLPEWITAKFEFLHRYALGYGGANGHHVHSNSANVRRQ